MKHPLLGPRQEVILPWPDKRLSPNARLHWAAKARLSAAARSEAFWLSKEQMHTPFDEIPNSVKVYITPPDKRRRDKLNMIASFKAAQDGIADAIKWDDQHWNEDYIITEPKKPGQIKVVFG